MFRYLQEEDVKKGYLALLRELTVAPDLLEEEFKKILKSLGEEYHILVYEKENKVLATATLLVEQKFIHSGGKVGHIEDVVVSSSERGKDLGKKIVESLLKIAQEEGCYKVILNCKKELAFFYEKNGFKEKDIQMVISLK